MLVKVVRQWWHLTSNWRAEDRCVLSQLVAGQCAVERSEAEAGHKGRCSTDCRSMRSGDRTKDPRNLSTEKTCREEGQSLAS